MDRLRVRVYNVRFGDALLISVPDRDPSGETQTRHILVDVGNAYTGEGGEDVLFRPVIEDVLDVLDGSPLDLYVMTHEHMDHVQGLLYADRKLLPDEDLRARLKTRHAWLTASAEPGYYDTHEDAKRHLDQARSIYEATERFLQASPEHETPWLRALMMNNNPRRTADCVEFLRDLAEHTWYVHRESELEGKHPFQEAQFEIWGPEEDTSVYYGHFQPMALGVKPGRGSRGKPTLGVPTPPPGVDAGTFYNLVGMRRRGYADNLLAIDRAANDTSLVFCLKWRGWRLLFAGDAEIRSWKTMNKYVEFEPVHFLKVSHHGSHNGTPSGELLDRILPGESPEPCDAVVSAYPETYNNVPHDKTLAELERRCRLFSVLGLPDGSYLDFEFAADENDPPGTVTVQAQDLGAG